MTIERWGSLSVADHCDTAGLVANVMLYDRLVMPMFDPDASREILNSDLDPDSSQRIESELDYWNKKGWNPELQAERFKQLGDLARSAVWNDARRLNFSDIYAKNKKDPQYITREMLTEKPDQYEWPDDVSDVDIYTAYPSQQKAQDNIPFAPVNTEGLSDYSIVAVLLAHEFEIPKIKEPEVALREAIALAKEKDFREKRENLYAFQKAMVKDDRGPEVIVNELKNLNQELSEFYKKQKIQTIKKTGFMLAQVSFSALAGAFVHPAAALGGLISLWEFTACMPSLHEGMPQKLQAVAGFHDMKKHVGIGFKP